MNLGTTLARAIAFLRDTGPAGVVLWTLAVLAALLTLTFFVTRQVSKLQYFKSFDVGPKFDHYYSHALPAFGSGMTGLVRATYALSLAPTFYGDSDLTWFDVWQNASFIYRTAAVIVAAVAAYAAIQLLIALWYALRWIQLEARGIDWHVAGNGEAFRIVWRRPDGEFLFDTTIRAHRMAEQLMAIRARRAHLVITAAMAAASILGLQFLPPLMSLIGSWLPPTMAAALDAQAVQIIMRLAVLLAVIPTMTGLGAAILDELAYRAGGQYITGSSVRDPRPIPLGREHVESQKVHGDADFVSAVEAVQRMMGPG